MDQQDSIVPVTVPDQIEEDISQPLLKPKQKRNYTDEQRAAARDRMIKVNNDRIANAQHSRQKQKEISKLKLIKRRELIDENLEKLKEEVKEPPAKVKKSKSKRNIKIVEIASSSSESDSEDSDDDVSIPEAKIIVLKKSKSITKPKAEKHVSKPVAAPVPAPAPVIMHKFL